jgi:hypothetical protein
MPLADAANEEAAHFESILEPLLRMLMALRRRGELYDLIEKIV